MTSSRCLIPAAVAALLAVSASPARADLYLEDGRLVEPTAWTHYNAQCPTGPATFTRILVLTPHGHRFGRRHVRRNGDVIWKSRHGIVKWTRRGTIINHAARTAMFVAFCRT